MDDQSPFQLEARQGLTILISCAIVSIILWQIPLGRYILYPFTILATWFHEMGHGLTAMVLGGNFHKLLLYPNGSGVAYHSGSVALGSLGLALVAAGGPVGPAIAGSLLILTSRDRRRGHLALMLLGCFMVVSVVLWVRSLFGIITIGAMGIGIIILSSQVSSRLQIFMVQLLGVQACISTFKQFDYLMIARANIGGQTMTSDTGHIAQHLFLPHWFWGILIMIFCGFLMVQSLKAVYGDQI